MPDSLSDLKRRNLEKRLADLQQEYEAANRQLSRALSDVDRLRIQRQIGDLEGDIQQVENELHQIASSATFTNVRNKSQTTAESHSGVNIGNVEGGIHGSVIGGRDVVNASTPITSGAPSIPYSTQEAIDTQKVIKSRLYDWKWIVGTLIAIISCVGTWLAVPGALTFFHRAVTTTPTAVSTVAEVSKDVAPQATSESMNTSTSSPSPTLTLPPTVTEPATSSAPTILPVDSISIPREYGKGKSFAAREQVGPGNHYIRYSLQSDSEWENAGVSWDFNEPTDLTNYKYLEVTVSISDNSMACWLWLSNSLDTDHKPFVVLGTEIPSSYWNSSSVEDKPFFKVDTTPQMIRIPLTNYGGSNYLSSITAIGFEADTEFVRGEHSMTVSNLQFSK